MKNKVLVVGLTGGIGSGKSSFASEFEKNGIPVYYSDERAKNLMNNSNRLITGIKHLFGEESYLKGSLNREYLAKVVFSNKEKLSQLNSLVHPVVAEDFKLWVETENSKIVVKEAAILFESGAYKSCDVNVNIFAGIDERVDRVVKRDGVNSAQVLARISNQFSDEKRAELADINVENDDYNAIGDKVEKLIDSLNRLI